MANRGVNKVILIGNLGADAELRYTPNGTAVANFRVATTEVWKDKDGNLQERTEWHRVVAWRKLAEVAGEWFKKGQQVYIEGRLRTRSWEDKDGNKRFTTEIYADNVQMLGRKVEGEPAAAPEAVEPPEAPEPGLPAGAPEEDLPF